jgi:hypothetical protein
LPRVKNKKRYFIDNGHMGSQHRVVHIVREFSNSTFCLLCSD